MKPVRVAAAVAGVALAVFLVVWGSSAFRGEPIAVLTGVDSCWAGGEAGIEGLLVADAEFGTRFAGRPVMWPLGFTGVRVGDEVGVLDGSGKLVARTGRRYYISNAPVFAGDKAKLMKRLGAFPAAANCGYPWDLIDCSDPAGAVASQCRAKLP